MNLEVNRVFSAKEANERTDKVLLDMANKYIDTLEDSILEAIKKGDKSIFIENSKIWKFKNELIKQLELLGYKVEKIEDYYEESSGIKISWNEKENT